MGPFCPEETGTQRRTEGAPPGRAGPEVGDAETSEATASCHGSAAGVGDALLLEVVALVERGLNPGASCSETWEGLAPSCPLLFSFKL